MTPPPKLFQKFTRLGSLARPILDSDKSTYSLGPVCPGNVSSDENADFQFVSKLQNSGIILNPFQPDERDLQLHRDLLQH